MSFHKLKIGSRKKDPSRQGLSSNQKLRQKNEQAIGHLNLQARIQARKSNIISMSDDFHHDIFRLKKPEFTVAPKTERVHKIERMQFHASNAMQSHRVQNDKAYHFNYGPSQQNQEYSANQLIEFLNINKPSQSSKHEALIPKRAPNISSPVKEEIQSIQQVSKPRIHSIKQVGLSDVENKVRNAIQVKKKVIELEERPLNCQMVVVKQEENKKSNDMSLNKGENDQQIMKKQVKSILDQVLQVQKQEAVVEIKKQIKDEPTNNSLLLKANIQAFPQSQIVKKSDQLTTQCSITLNPTAESEVVKIDQINLSTLVQVSSVTQQNKEISELEPQQSPTQQPNQVTITTSLLPPRPSPSRSMQKPHLSTQSQSLIKTPQRTKQSHQVFSSQQKRKSASSQKSLPSPPPHQQPLTPSQPTIPSPSPTKSKLSYKPINEIQLTILNQNKTLTQDVQKLRKQRDQLLFSNKRYEVQLMQSNCKEYYEKEIARLKTQVENLQAVNEEIKHNSFVVQNKNRELESSDQLNRKQLKKVLKELEAIKIESTREKHELKEKSASLQSIIKQLEERNADLSDKFQEYYKKSQQLEKSYKQKCEQQTTLRNTCTLLETKIINAEKSSLDKLKHYEHEIQTHSSHKTQLQNEYRDFRRQSESEIESLRQNVKQFNLKRESQSLLISSRIKSLEKHNNSIEAELQVVRLQETVKELQTQIHKRTELIKELNNKIDSMISMNDYEELRKQLERVSQEKGQEKQLYEKEILTLCMEIEGLRRKLDDREKELKYERDSNVLCETTKGHQSNRPTDHSILQKQNFKQILKHQILQCDNLKQQLFAKSQQYFKLKQQHQDLQSQHDTLKNDQQILKKQFTSYQNNTKIKKQILQQELANDIESLKRKMGVLEKRFESKVRENKEKQEFIQGFIVGKAGSEGDAQYLAKELERIFLQRERVGV